MLVVIGDEADVPGHEEEEQPHQDETARHDYQLASLASTHFSALCLPSLSLSLEGQIKAKRKKVLHKLVKRST